jgi:hypothetical protein
MYVWLLIGAIVLLVALVIWNSRGLHEGMTVDPDTLQAQRQSLQMEGERRYNDVARLQNPQTLASTRDINAALAGIVPIPSTARASLLSLVGSSGGLGGADDGSNKSGDPLEQTGTLQQKITFCESLTAINCDMFANDPRMAECGFCHRDGTDSKGKAHRGGMYISPDDQIRANEAAKGGRASYKPTIGKCEPRNFTLVKENCEARERQLQCQAAGAATSNNACGQCYGAAPANATGLLYVGPKPRTYSAVLWVSHPGMHNNQGAGTVVNLPDGSTVSLPSSNNTLLNPMSIPLNSIKEGDNISITVYGFPRVWCAWLSSMDGNRTVSIDIGLQNIANYPGIVIAGDKRSTIVSTAANTYNADIWSTFQGKVPNTVLWFARRDEVLHGGITGAFYGDANRNGNDVTGLLKSAAGSGADFLVSSSTLGGDPSPGMTKFLTVTLDNGQAMNVTDGTTIPKTTLKNVVTLAVTIPATLVDPLYADDKADCPSGPMVFTEIGAGLMGAHSCFKADGSFNPTQYCLQELFRAAGGTPQGAAFPNTDAKAAALVINNSLDDTVANMNKLATIALYGVDMNGVEAIFNDFKTASMQMLGTTPANPCDGPNAASGPHTAECLDYLWRTSGNSSADNAPLTTLPTYGFCSPDGFGAPLSADGSTVNAANVSSANALGSVSAIRGAYQTLYGRARTTGDFDVQAAAMRDCYGTNLQPPFVPPGNCPPTNPTQWQCFSPQMDQQPEVFYVEPNGGYTVKLSDAEGVCSTYSARLATDSDLAAAQSAGADWCATGWLLGSTDAKYPITTTTVGGCGNGSAGVMTYTPGTAGVNCYGVKPPPGTLNVLSFATGGAYYQPQTVAPGATLSFSQGSGNTITYMRHASFQLWLHPTDNGPVPGDMMKNDSTFLIVPARSGDPAMVSFQSVNYPDHYIRHSNFIAYLQPDTGGPFSMDSSFKIGPSVNGNAKQISIQASNFPGYYLTAVGTQVNMVSQSDGSFSANSASWTIHVPNNGAPAATSQAVNAYREINGTVQCASSDGQTCITYADMPTCNTATGSMTASQTVSRPPADMATQIDQYFAARI